MKRKAFTLVEFLVVVLVVAILAAIFFPVFPRGNHGNSRRSSCQSNLKQISLAFKQYIQDFDEKWPPVAVVQSGNWAGSIQPYIKSWQVFQCPSDKVGSTLQTTDYFYNSRLAKQKEEDIEFSSITILLGEGIGDSPTNYSLAELPKSWRNDSTSPAWRHLDGANYAFADGHVKWLRPEKVSVEKPLIGKYTFLVK